MSTPPSISPLLRPSTPPPAPAATSSTPPADISVPAAAESSRGTSADEQKGRTAERAIENFITQAQHEVLLKALEDLDSDYNSSAKAPAGAVADSDKILEQELAKLNLEENQATIDALLQQSEAQQAALAQHFVTYTNQSLEACNRFFQDLLRQPPATLKLWLETQSKSQYLPYQFSGPFSPFHAAKALRLQLNNEPDFRKTLNPSHVSTFTVIFTASEAKLKAFKLDSYLQEIPEELQRLDAFAAKFLTLPETFPQNLQELTEWYNALSESERLVFPQLLAMGHCLEPDSEKNSHVAPPNVAKSLPKIRLFLDRITEKGLDQQFNELIFQASIKMLAQNMPLINQFLSLGKNPQQEKPT